MLLEITKNLVRGAIGNNNNSGRGSKDTKRSVAQVLSAQLPSLQRSDLRASAKWVLTFVARKTPILSIEPRRDQRQLTPIEVIRTQDLITQLAWTAEVLGHCTPLLTRFSDLSDLFERQWLDNELEKAEQTLNQIEAETGKSLWLIETRLAFLQKVKGLESQKEYVRAIYANRPAGMATFVAHHIGIRNEDGVSLAKFQQTTRTTINRQRIDDPIKTYLRFILLGETRLAEDQLVDILSTALAVSAVDGYQALMAVMGCAGTSEDLTHHWPLLDTICERFEACDPQFIRFRELFSAALVARDLMPTAPMDSFRSGNYQDAMNEACQIVAHCPTCVDALRIVAAAHALGVPIPKDANIPSLLRPIVEPLATVFQRKGGMRQSASELSKYFANLRTLRRLRCLHGYFAHDWVETRPVGTSKATEAFIYSDHLTVLHILLVPLNIAKALLAKLAMCAGGVSTNVALAQLQLVEANEPGVPSGQWLEAKTLGALLLGDISDALNAANELRIDASEPWTRRSSGLIIGALLDSKDLATSIEQAAAFCCDVEDLKHTLPLRRMFGGASWKNLMQFRDRIALPISLHAHVEATNDSEHEVTLRAAYDEFLIANEVIKPSELSLVDLPIDHLIYFLKHVCVPDIMDVSFRAFSSSRQILEERVKICQILIENDPKNSAAYGAEIGDLTKTINLQDALRNFDRSRVHVNVQAIRRWCHAELGESFRRYKDLLASGPGFANGREFEAAWVRAESGDIAALAPYMVYPETQGDELLFEMIHLAEREYLVNQDHGLDAYLSMRVRHGSLAGYIRGPLQSASIVCAKRGDSGDYLDNEFWKSELGTIPASAQESLQGALKEFSKLVDKSIEVLIKDKLQIGSAIHPEGVFGVDQEAMWLHAMRSHIQPNSELDEFLDIVFTSIQIRLSKRLTIVRGLLEFDLKNQIEGALDNLRMALEQSLPHSAYARVNQKIAEAAPDLQGAIERVSDWFVVGREAVNEQGLTLDWIIDVATEATKSANVGFSPIITRNVGHLPPFDAPVLSEFVDAMFLILGNVAHHSHVWPSPQIVIDVTERKLGETRSAVSIRVESEVSDGIYNEHIESKLDRIRAIIVSGDYKSRVNLEGGTGLLKLQRIVEKDARRALTFGFIGPTKFFCQIEVVAVVQEQQTASQ